MYEVSRAPVFLLFQLVCFAVVLYAASDIIRRVRHPRRGVSEGASSEVSQLGLSGFREWQSTRKMYG